MRHLSAPPYDQLSKISKVCIIQLVHICFEKSSSTFWKVRCCSCQKYVEDFFKFFGLLRKPKLSQTPRSAQKIYTEANCQKDQSSQNVRFCFIKRARHRTLLEGLWPQQATATKYTQISSTAHLKFLEYVNIASLCACSKMHIKQMFWQFCFLLKRHRINKWNDKKKSINIISTSFMTNSMLLLT